MLNPFEKVVFNLDVRWDLVWSIISGGSLYSILLPHNSTAALASDSNTMYTDVSTSAEHLSQLS